MLQTVGYLHLYMKLLRRDELSYVLYW